MCPLLLFAVATELRGGGGLQAGHHLRPLPGLLQQVGHDDDNDFITSSYPLCPLLGVLKQVIYQSQISCSTSNFALGTFDEMCFFPDN